MDFDNDLADPRSDLFGFLSRLGIEAPTVPYPAHRTVEEGKALRGAMADEDRTIDLKRLHLHIGAQGRLGFAAAEQMREILNVEPGSLTPFSLLRDTKGRVNVVIDASLMAAALLEFMQACEHTPRIVDFGAMAEA